MSTQRVPIALHQGVMGCLRQKLQLANQRLGKHYSEPHLNYQLRGTRAGVAALANWEIRLNPVLLCENGTAFIQQVVPHELAHLLVYQQATDAPPHGRLWRWMMEQILDTPANATHSFSIHSVQGTTYSYQCACQHHQLTVRRHRRVLRQKQHYQCLKCGEKLIFIDDPLAQREPHCSLLP